MFLLPCVLAACVAGCARTTVRQVEATDYDPNDENAELDFWHNLPGRSAVTNDEGLHGVLVFADGQDPTRSYSDRIALLKERGWITKGFDEPGTLAMQRGTLAKALCHVLEVKGGVMMRVTDKSPRYAARELMYLGILAPGTEQQVLSGLDYLGVISKAQDYQMLRDAGGTAPNRPVESVGEAQ
jgi:hypothetical protein